MFYYIYIYIHICVLNNRLRKPKGQSGMDNPEKLATLGTQDTGGIQSKETGNIGHARHRRKAIQRNWQHWTRKTQEEDNPEKLTTLGTQDINCNNVAPVTNLCLGRATTRSHSSQWSKKKLQLKHKNSLFTLQTFHYNYYWWSQSLLNRFGWEMYAFQR